MHRALRLFLLAALLLACGTVYADDTGKIWGMVVDKATGEPIIGANVIIEGTSRGAASDLDGFFVILAVVPGTYNVSASAVGYAKVTIKDVIVEAEKTTDLEFELEGSSVQLEDVILVYEKPSVEKGVTSNVTRYSAEDVQYQADPDAVAVLRATPGFKVDQEGKIIIRQNGEYIGLPRNAPPPRSPVQPPIQPLPMEDRETFGEWIPNTWERADVNPLSTFSIDVDKASYTRTRRYLLDDTLPPSESVRIEELVNFFEYEYESPDHDKPFSITTELAACPWNEDHQLLHIGLQGRQYDYDDIPPANFVFLIDVSGSMEPGDKLPLLKKGLRMLVERLRPQDRVALVTYADDAAVYLPSTSGRDKNVILASINGLRASGWTAGGAGIMLAYDTAAENFDSERNNRVILCTDGDFNVGLQSTEALDSLISVKREGGFFLTVMGFGAKITQHQKMEILADRGNGVYYYVDDILEAKRVFSEDLGSLLTIAKDVKLQVEFNPVEVAEYRLIGYENRLLDDEDFDDDTKDAGEFGAGQSVTVLYEIVPQANLQRAGKRFMRYQRSILTEEAFWSNEIVTVNIRYKRPSSDESTLLVLHGQADASSLDQASSNFRWAAAVAEFGLLLRGSDQKGSATYDHVIDLARNARGVDLEGTRAEFIHLAERAQLLAEPQVADVED